MVDGAGHVSQMRSSSNASYPVSCSSRESQRMHGLVPDWLDGWLVDSNSGWQGIIYYCTVSGWRATAANFRPSEVDPLSPLESSRPELTGQRTPARLVAVSASTAPAHLRQSARAGMGPPLRVLCVRVRAFVSLFAFSAPLFSRRPSSLRDWTNGRPASQPVIQPSLAQPSRAPPRQPDNQPASQAMPGQGKPVAEPNSTRI